MLFLPLPSSSPIWPLCALLVIAANVGFRDSVVVMNAYLPMLAREDEEVVNTLKELRATQGSTTETPERSSAEDGLHGGEEASEPLLPAPELPVVSQEESSLQDQHAAILSSATTRIFAGIVTLILALIPVTLLKGSTFALRLAVAASGAWWPVFTIPAWLWLPSRDGKIVDDSDTLFGSGRVRLRSEIARAWRELGGMLRPS